jgi:aspartyl-tRNA(Asn)/glutamyl-tRNA(Gln) amidotransferase subunit A
MIDLTTLTIAKARGSILAGEYTSLDLVNAYLENIKNKDGEIHAYLEVFQDALDHSKAFDALPLEEKEKLPLGGIPVALKDNILLEGKKCTAASKILEQYTASYDATVVTKLKEAGAIFIGRTNMDDGAMGGSTENSAYGPTKNPHDTSRVPGGSSGGSAAVIAANMALIALGSDTGGSIRQPASYCGIVGLKPTYGSVSRHGLIAMASSLDVIGPMTKNIYDAEIVYNIIKGKDKMDGTSREGSVQNTKKEIKIIGVPRSFMQKGVDVDVLKNFEDSLKKLQGDGFEIVDIELPLLPYALSVYYILMPAEVSSNLARIDGVRYGSREAGETLSEVYKKTRGTLFGKEVRRRIMLGTYVLSSGYYDSYYGKALALRAKIKEDFEKAFANVDIIATPVAPTPAFKIGKNSNDPLQMYLEDIFTVGANLAGIPAISIPSGFKNEEGKQLPIGIQFMASEFGEVILFEIGKKFSV